MEPGLSDTQRMFLDTTVRLLDEHGGLGRVRELIGDPVGFDRSLWQRGGDLGWYAMLVPEKYGGGSVSDSGLADAALVAEAMGARVHPGPFLPTNVVAFAISEYGSDDQKARLLPGLAAGTTIATWAYAETGGDWSPSAIEVRATPSGDGYQIEGTKSYVQDAGTADVFLVTARAPEGLVQVLVPATGAGVTVEPLESLDLARRMAEVTFMETPVDQSDVVCAGSFATEAVERQLQVALVLQCAETNGATQAGLDMTVDYAKERVAFGRPIGSYQALKHRMADHRMWLEGSYATTAYATASAHGRCPDASTAVRVAKAHVGRWSTHILHDCIQIHGGIGMTWEYDLHLYFRRVISNEVLYGAPYDHMKHLVDLVEAAAQ